MGNVTDALKTAGVKVPPLNKRVWLWLHDHPNKTYTEIGAAINEPPSNVSGTLSAMQKRGMVQGAREYMRGTNRLVTRYCTLGKSFALKPLPTPKLEAEPKVEVQVAAELPKMPPEAVAKSLLDTLSVKEAFALYQELRAMFRQE